MYLLETRFLSSVPSVACHVTTKVGGCFMSVDKSQKPASHLVRFVYISKSLVTPYYPDFLELIKVSSVNNERNNITGILYFDKLYFIQLIEGEVENILNLREKILRDVRHFGVRELLFESISHRKHDGWEFKFCDGTAANPLFGFKPSSKSIFDALAGNGEELIKGLDSLGFGPR